MSRDPRGRSAFAIPSRLLGPEALLLGALLALTRVPAAADVVVPRAEILFALFATAGLGLGWRFARGRVIHGLMILAGALALHQAAGPAGTIGALLVPLNLAAIALLPDRGIITRGGLFRAGAIVAQAGVLVVAVPLLAGGVDPLARIVIPAAGLELDAVLVAYVVALAVLAALALAGGEAPARGALWATGAALIAHLGHPAGATYVLAAGGGVLVLAAVEAAHALAYRDALTGLPSRRALDELLDRTGRRYTVAMVDVDHFKAVNDRHGHDVGDQVLRLVATKLRTVGGGARAFRYGGEEFTLVFRGRSLEDARPHLDAVRRAIGSAEFVVRGADRPKKRPRRVLPARRPLKKLKVTVSIGAAERKDRSRPSGEVLKAADRALYRAKEGGRNRVVAGG